MRRFVPPIPVLIGLLAPLLLLACDREDEPARTGAAAPAAARITPEPGFAPVLDSALAAARAAGNDWPVHGGSYTSQRYSTLDQITRENVAGLAPVWVYQSGVPGGFDTTPVVVDNTLYLTTAESHVVALNAATGEELWHFVPELEPTPVCCGPVNRGVAVYDDKVFVGTLDARLVALDRRDGSVEWQTQVGDPEDGYSITMAPLAYAGKVLVGVSGGEYGIRGFVSAYDADSGDRAWRFHTIPGPGDAPNGWWGEWSQTTPFGTPLDRDLLQEREDSASNADAWERGGGGVWVTPSYAPETGTLYLVVGNPSPDLAGSVRPGDNLYTGSIVALDGETGELKWYFQYLPHDRWNLSGGSPPFLFRIDGTEYVGHAGKTGWLYIVDGRSGRPVLRSQNFIPQQNLFTTPSRDGTPMAPGTLGGNGGSPVAYSPRTGLAYIPALHQPMIYRRAFTSRQDGVPWLGGTISPVPDEEQWGTLSAIDVRTGAIRWQHEVPQPMLGGALVTAGDILFAGQGNGTFDAFDAESGEMLWQFQTGAGVHGGPVTYAVGGTQYVVVAAGGNHQLDTPPGDDLYAFALGGAQDAVGLRTYDTPAYRRAEPHRYRAVRQVPREQMERSRERPESSEPSEPSRPQR